MSLSIRMVLFRAAIFIGLMAESLLGVRVSHGADDCLTKPNAAPPQGKHWYYRTDRTTQRQCWYLGPEDEKVRARVHQSTTVVRPAAAPNLVSSQTFDAASIESTASGAKVTEDLPVLMASLETSGLGRPNQRMRDDVLIRSGSAHDHSAREISDVAMAASSDLAPAERPADSAITFGHLLAIFTAVLVLVGIIVRTIFRFSGVRQSGRTNARDRRDLTSKSCLGEHAKSSSLGEYAEAQLSNSDTAVDPDVFRPDMDPMTRPVREHSWPEIEASVRLLLRELQLRQHHNETFRMHTAQNAHVRS